jgi:ABC-2 type transport system permease protein
VNKESVGCHWAASSRFLRTIRAFLRRDLRIELTYRLSFFFQIANVFFTVIFFAFLSRLMGASAKPYLHPYGGTYLSFVFLGIAFNCYMFNGLMCFGDHLRKAQLAGTLEAVLMTPVSLPVFVLSSGLWGHVETSLRALAYVIAGVLMGMDLSSANIPGAFLVLILGVLAFDALGILGAAVVMLTQRELPFVGAFSTATALLTGVFFPVELLPSQVKWVAKLIPSTYALEGLRLALLQGVSTSALLAQIAPLTGFVVLLLSLAFWAFFLAARRSMANGSLMQY